MKTIVINFKTYPEATGSNAVKLTEACDNVAKRHNDVEIIVCPQYTDLTVTRRFNNIKIFAQHIDSVEPGKNTGSVTALAAKEAGVVGTLISHSEKKLSIEEIRGCVEAARKNGLRTLVCSDGMERTKKIVEFSPDYVAYEDPVLIGSGNSISKAKPDDVREFVDVVANANRKVVPLCGAGISNGSDARDALRLGTKGVILASAFVKSGDPEKFLEDMIKSIE